MDQASTIAEAIRMTSAVPTLEDLGGMMRAMRPRHAFVTALRSGGPIRRPPRHGADWIHLGSDDEWRNVCSGEPIGLDLDDYLAEDWETMVPIPPPSSSTSPSSSWTSSSTSHLDVGTFPWAIAQGRPIQRSSSILQDWLILGRKTWGREQASIGCFRTLARGKERLLCASDYLAIDWLIAGTDLLPEKLPGNAPQDPPAGSTTSSTSTAATPPSTRAPS